MKSLLVFVMFFAWSLCQAENFTFVALGDAPYVREEGDYKTYEALIGKINSYQPDLVIHVGDTKTGGTLCSDEMLDRQLDYFNTYDSAVLYSPGDNEWTDCHRKFTGAYDPLERLAYIREHYFAKPELSLGARKITVKHQGNEGYPENVRVLHKDILFVTLHIVGSNNNFRPDDENATKEFFARDKANIKWLKESFDDALLSGAKAIVIGIQADIFDVRNRPYGYLEKFYLGSSFANFGNTLIQQTNLLNKPVLLIHGDTHQFRMMRPFIEKSPQLFAMQVFGDRNMHAVKISVNDEIFPFSFQPLINPEKPISATSVKKK